MTGLESRPRRRVVPALLATAVLLAPSWAQGAVELGEADRAWLRAHPVVRVGVEARYAPFLFTGKDGKPAGVAVDYLSAIERDLGVRFEFAPPADLSAVLGRMRTGEVDLHPALARTPEREAYLRFTAPYFSVPTVMVVRQGYSGPVDPASAPGIRVCVGAGYALEEYLRRSHPLLALSPEPNDETCLRKVAGGAVDAAAMDLASASYLVAATGLPGLRAQGDLGYRYELAMATRADWPAFPSILDQALQGIDPVEVRRIREEWVGLQRPADVAGGVRWAGLVVTALVAIAAALGLWGVNRALRAVVRRRTAELAASEERYRKLFDSMDLGLVVQGADGRIIAANPAAQRILGVGLQDLLDRPGGTAAWDAVLEDGTPLDPGRLDAGRPVAQGGEFRDRVVGVRHASTGRRIWLNANAIPYREADGAISAVFTFQDVTAAREASQAIQDSEKKFRALFEQSVDGIVVADAATGALVDCNPSFLSLTRWTREEVLRLRLRDLHRPDEAARIQGEVQRIASGRGSGVTTAMMLRKDGSTFPAEIRAVRFSVEGRDFLAGVFRDVTEQQRADDEVRAAWQFARSTLDAIPEQICVLDDRGVIISTNRTWRLTAEEHGGSAAQLSEGANYLEVAAGAAGADAEEGHAFARQLRQVIVGEIPSFSLEYACHSAVRRRWFVARATRFLDRGRVRVTVVHQEITQHRLAEEDLLRSEQRARQLLERSSDLTLIIDPRRTITYANPASREVLGREPSELVGLDLAGIVHPDDAERMRGAVAEILGVSGGSQRLELRVRRHDGTWALVESELRNLVDAPGVDGIVVNNRDITERNRYRDQLQQSQKLESIGRLAGGVAHDFNNLLTIILSCGESLRRQMPEEPSEAREDVEDILAACRRASGLTRQLLAFARKQIIEPEEASLSELLRQSKKLLVRVIGEDVRIVEDLPDGLWLVRCDPGLVSQVVVNLAVNARDAMPEGGTLTLSTANVVFRADQERPDPEMLPGKYVRLTVADTGTGMTPEVLEHIFEPFFTTKAAGVGTGLGLATVYGIIKQSGAHVAVRSAPGEGTRFDIYFPRVVTEGTGAVEEAPPPPGGEETVLVVEDDAKVRAVTERVLRSGGYRVLAASGGEEALDAVRRETAPIHMVLTDVVMPGMGGREVARRVAELRPGIKVLFASGYTHDAISRQGILDEGIEFLPKPFTPASLLRRVRAVLDQG